MEEIVKQLLKYAKLNDEIELLLQSLSKIEIIEKSIYSDTDFINLVNDVLLLKNKIENDKNFLKLPHEAKAEFYRLSAKIIAIVAKIQEEKYKITKKGIINIKVEINDYNSTNISNIIEMFLESNNYLRKANYTILSNQYPLVLKQYARNYDSLGILYYLKDEEEKFVECETKAIEFGSFHGYKFLIWFYSSKGNKGEMNYYYKKCLNTIIDDKNPNKYIHEIAKLEALCYAYGYYYNNGFYSQSKEIIKDIKKYIKTASLLKNDSKIDNMIIEFENNCNKYLKEEEKQKFDDSSLKDEFRIKYYLSDKTIKLMEKNIKIYISTSLEMFNYFSKSKRSIDYSPVIISILKSIETIMYEIIINNYLVFLNNLKDIDLTFVDKGLKKRNSLELPENIDFLEYGTVCHSIIKTFGDKYIINKYFFDFCKSNGIKKADEVILKLYTSIDNLRKIRNRVAHKSRVYIFDAIECKDILLDNIRFIEFLYDNFDFCFDKKDK